MDVRVGIGYDVHAFAENRRLVLGGVGIDHPLGLLGHSDADVLLHAIIDALLGAASLGDIGRLFPDSNPSLRDASSLDLLKQVYDLLSGHGVTVLNIDSVVICEKPKISPHVDAMKAAISRALGDLTPARIGIKGKTTEGLGFAGRREGIAAQAVALVRLD
ncbi:MAG: 2-C-methyl-D-erythritol 2,4-cyclodiphosphate synthase [Spirochaetales bacterium]|nr:MAG: 2-C-methyl-D-erythritol 2,4-cyclodiphosphate synthase [Spirochaetales bacterium]